MVTAHLKSCDFCWGHPFSTGLPYLYFSDLIPHLQG